MSKVAKLAESLKSRLTLKEAYYEDKAKQLKGIQLKITELAVPHFEADGWVRKELEAHQKELGNIKESRGSAFTFFEFSKPQPFSFFKGITDKLVADGTAKMGNLGFEAGNRYTPIRFKDGYWRTQGVSDDRTLVYVGSAWYFEDELNAK